MKLVTYFLDKIQDHIESINNLKFDSSGIFTNAIVRKPNITFLLKDPSPDESLLYKISKKNTTNNNLKIQNEIKINDNLLNKHSIELKPQRIDEIITYTDTSLIDFPSIHFMDVENRDFNDQNIKSIVSIPTKITFESEPPNIAFNFKKKNITASTDFLPHPKKKRKSFLDVSDKNITKDFKRLSYEVFNLINKYPNLIENHDDLYQKILWYQSEYEKSKKIISDLEFKIANQKKQLNLLNISYNDSISPIKSDCSLYADHENDDYEYDQLISSFPKKNSNLKKNINFDDLIRHEQQEIIELEEKLNQKQRENF